MIKNIKRLSLIALSALAITGCTKKQDIQPRDNVYPSVQVTVTNAADYRPDPTVTTPLASGAIQIVLSIPAGSGRTIKEITRVSAATTYTAVQGTGTPYASAIAGSGTSVTFNTSITEYFVKVPVSTANPAAKINTELANRFYFTVTLDDGSVIVTMPVRVLVL
jgi:hypothetical protein